MKLRTGSVSTLAVAAILASSMMPAPTSAGVVSSLWGWVTVRQPTTASYTPGAKDQGNSSLGTNTVERVGTGEYRVRFGGLNAASPSCGGSNGCSGATMVTALSATQRTCLPSELGSALPVTVFVNCYDRLGNAADSGFSVNFLAARDNVGTLAYLYANDPVSVAYTPDLNYNHNSVSVGENSVEWSNPGRYEVYLPGETHAGTRGNLQVRATFGTCKLERRFDIASPQVFSGAAVRCRDFAGNDANQTFWLTFTDQIGLKGTTDGSSAYVFANRPTTASYQPAAAFRFSSSGMTPTITRSAVGRYSLKLPGMPLGGSAQVTAFGTDKAQCQLSSIRKTGAPQRIGVACFKPNGAFVDSAFYLSFTR